MLPTGCSQCTYIRTSPFMIVISSAYRHSDPRGYIAEANQKTSRGQCTLQLRVPCGSRASLPPAFVIPESCAGIPVLIVCETHKHTKEANKKKSTPTLIIPRPPSVLCECPFPSSHLSICFHWLSSFGHLKKLPWERLSKSIWIGSALSIMDKIIICTVQVGERFRFGFVREENSEVRMSKLATQNTEILTGSCQCQRQESYPTTGKCQKQRITLRGRIAMLTFCVQKGFVF